MNRTRVLTGSAAILAALALSACQPAQAGSAAVVSGERITVASLQDTTASLLDAGGADEPRGVAQRETLVRMIRSRVYDAAAQSQGLVVTDRQVQQRRVELVEQVGGEEQLERELVSQFNIPPSYQEQFLRDVVTAEQLGEKLVPGDPAQVQQERTEALNELLLETGRDLDIEVSPRYGTWDEGTLQIDGLVSGGLAQTPQELAAEQG